MPRCDSDAAAPRRAPRASRLRRWAAVLGLTLCGCERELVVGTWTCAQTVDAAQRADETTPVPLPFSTSFEDGFCDYTQRAGFCYGDRLATYTTVTSPVRTGRSAAAFEIRSDDPAAHQARCVVEGVLPEAAYYGAWYFVPRRATNSGLWNLVHFQGGDRSALHGLWDISLENGADGQLALMVYEFRTSRVHYPENPTPIPIGSWFHIELYLERAKDETGEVALYQDGDELLRLSNIVTDDTDWGQWYVGNLASGLRPADSTVYVDDVAIRSSR